MKRQTQTVGVRKWAGDDLVSLQSETLKALDAFFAEYGPCVIQGCEITVSADGSGTYDVAEGLVALMADDQQGGQRVMVMPFPGAEGVALPLYLTAAVETISEAYGDGKVKPIAYSYKATAVGAEPGEDVPYMTLTEAGGNRFVDVVQDDGHRFITDNERAKWNAILQQAKEYADSVASTGSAAALRSAKEYTDQREEAILAEVDTRDDEMLKAAKAYVETVLAAYVGSAPETLDTLQELAAALGNDPNFSATVMQMIGERVTTEAMNAALSKYLPLAGGDITGNLSVGGNAVWHAGNLKLSELLSYLGDANAGSKLSAKMNGYGYAYQGSESPTNGSYITFGMPIDGGYTQAQILLTNGASPEMYFRYSYGTNQWSDWRKVWHAGNFDPTLYPKRDVMGWRAETNCDNMVQEGTYDICAEKQFTNCPFFGYGQLFCFRTNVAVTQLAFQSSTGKMWIRTKYSTNLQFNSWVEVYHSGNLGAATSSAAGLMSAADKAKLDGIAAGGMKLLGAGVFDGVGASIVKKTGCVTGGYRANGTGYYRIAHNINHLNYEVQATCSPTSGRNGYVSIRSKTATYFDVYTGDDETENDISFFFQIYEFV